MRMCHFGSNTCMAAVKIDDKAGDQNTDIFACEYVRACLCACVRLLIVDGGREGEREKERGWWVGGWGGWWVGG